MNFDSRQNVIFPQYLKNELITFNRIVHMKLTLAIYT